MESFQTINLLYTSTSKTAQTPAYPQQPWNDPGMRVTSLLENHLLTVALRHQHISVEPLCGYKVPRIGANILGLGL